MSHKILNKGGSPNQQETQLYDRITKIQTDVLERIQKLKNLGKTSICHHLDIPVEDCEDYNPEINYYDRYWKRFLVNQIGKRTISQLRDSIDHFTKRLLKIDTLFAQRQQQLRPYEINKMKYGKIGKDNDHQCKLCNKLYHEESALQIHLKIKHNQGNDLKVKGEGESQIFQQSGEAND